ncbi:MAG: radical SAM protein [Promethearchaeia archaeon]
MNDIDALIKRIKAQKTSWTDYQQILKVTDTVKLEKIFSEAYNIKKENFGDILKIYIPDKKFPAISITGNDCALHCEHCNEKYLKGMKPILSNQKLENFLTCHIKEGGVGVLLSGGCNEDGAVPLKGFLDTVKKVKTKSNVIINVHTGLLDRETAEKLAEAKVDIISFDINLDKEIIENIYHLDKTINDYKKAIEILKEYNLNIIPHICIGLHYGELHKELEALKFIKKINLDPSIIVLIALIPPKKKKNKFSTPKPYDIAKIASITRFTFPESEISLGCMRPRGKVRIDIELNSIKSGITRIEMPSAKTLKQIKNYDEKIKFKVFTACCAIPKKYEKIAATKNPKYLNYLGI